jgi:hypothetical protein
VVRLSLDEAGDIIGMEADDRPRQDGHVVQPCPWFGRGGDYRTIGGRRIPTRAEAVGDSTASNLFIGVDASSPGRKTWLRFTSTDVHEDGACRTSVPEALHPGKRQPL